MKYARRLLRDVEGYVPGEQPRAAQVVKLNTNENPYPPSPRVLEALRALSAGQLRRYPDPLSTAFREACARRYGCPNADWVIAGNGMDELLALAVRTFVDPGDRVLAMYPTYSLYEVLCRLHGAELLSVDLDDDFALPETFFKAQARMCFFTRPNAPTGHCAPRADVERFCAGFNGVVVIDEAYVDFADDNCMDFARRFDNVVVMRTFSKSFSLAGMRIGVAAANPALIKEFLKTKDSYNMDTVSQAAGLAAIEDYAHMEQNVAKVRATRARLMGDLHRLGFAAGASQANFVLARWTGVPSALEIFEALRERGIFVRYFNLRRLSDSLRISVGTDEECAALITALEDILARRA